MEPLHGIKFWYRTRLAALLLIVNLVSCVQDPNMPVKFAEMEAFKIPAHFPVPVIPADNFPTPERIQLGKALFFDTRLSVNGNISCASCHKPEFAFADTLKLPKGTEGNLGKRNTPSIMNVAWYPYFLREGSVPDLERQVLVPIQEQHEFNNNILLIVNRLKNDPEYHKRSMKAYQRPLDAWVLTRAISSYERSLVSANSPYDQWLNGNKTALSKEAKAGISLFYDSLNCGSCHAGILQTHFGFANNGLYDLYSDPGRRRFTRLPEDEGKFKIPSLRNVSLTAPYMHDGSLPDLMSVIDHYAKGGKDHVNKDTSIKPFAITEQQKRELLAFLEALKG